MEPGDLVKDIRNQLSHGELGLFMGMRTFRACGNVRTQDYTCAEVMWLHKTAPNGDRISTIQADLLEVVSKADRAEETEDQKKYFNPSNQESYDC